MSCSVLRLLIVKRQRFALNQAFFNRRCLTRSIGGNDLRADRIAHSVKELAAPGSVVPALLRDALDVLLIVHPTRPVVVIQRLAGVFGAGLAGRDVFAPSEAAASDAPVAALQQDDDEVEDNWEDWA